MTEPARDWDEGWAQLETTINVRDVWLLTDHLKRRYLSELIPSQARILEVGCGSAKLSTLLAERGGRIFGLDRSAQALRVARNNLVSVHVSGALVQGDVLQLPFAAEQFDVVLSTGLLEHFRNPVPIVAEMTRMLRPGGIFFSDVAPLKFSLLRAGFFARGYHKQVQDEYDYRASDIGRWLAQCDLRDIRVFSSGVVPPLGIIRRVPLLRDLSFRAEWLWTAVDGTWLADWLGFFYLAVARKGA